MNVPREAMPEETFLNLLEQVDDLIAVFENHPDETTREQATALLSGIDMLHREALTRLIDHVRESGGDALIDAASKDPAVNILLGLYGLTDLDLPPDEDDAARETAPETAMLRDVMERGRRPQWVEIARMQDVPSGSMLSAQIGDVRVLLVNIEGDVHAFRDACAGTDLPFEFGRIEGEDLVCPWHGCRYDVHTGKRRDDGEGRLQVFPITIRGSSIQLAVQQRG